MIIKPTVFVLGAGASMPYGFPSGNILVKQICAATAGIEYEDDSTALIDKGQILDRLKTRFGEDKIREFGNALYYSQRFSIDSFLEHRTEFIEIGKLAIALFILRMEILPNLFDFKRRENGCYQYLFDRMNANWQEFSNNNVSFITFNYDRSLEQYLFTSLQSTYGKSDKECAAHMHKIPIVHIHGKLGDLPWQSRNGINYGASFNTNKDPHYISTIARSAAEQIKIITENQEDTKELQEAFRLLAEADRIYFLGFGYNPTSLERLKINELPKLLETGYLKSKISLLKGTAYELEEAEMQSIEFKWNIRLPDNTSDSLLFLRKYAKLD